MKALRPALLALALALPATPACEPPVMVRDLLDSLPEADADYGLLTLPVQSVRRIPVDAHLPTDLVLLPGGGFAVLDGYEGRLLRFGPDAQPRPPLEGNGAWGRPVRAAALADGGFWMVDPGSPDTEGILLRVDPEGEVVHALALHPGDPARSGDTAPVGLITAGDALLVGDRGGRVSRIDPANGKVLSSIAQDVDGEPLATVVDFAPLEGGGFLATDALGPRVHRLDADGRPLSWVGHFGPWSGYLRKPKSAIGVADDEALLVVDSSFDAVQVFRMDGRPLGVLAEGREPVLLDHPVAVRRLPSGEVAVLAAGVAEVVLFRLDEGAVAEAVVTPPRRRLRTPLSDTEAGEAERAQDNCLQCHDGFVNDDRGNWDEELDHHPVGVVPEKDIPLFFPLDDAGRMVCTTCHSAHGWTTPEDARSAERSEDVRDLVRHQDESSAFLRVPIEHSGLCSACHGDSAHEEFLHSLGLEEGGHPVGPELERLLAKREGADVTRADCLGCHSPHAARGDKLLRSEEEGGFCLGCHAERADAALNHPLGRRVGRDVPRPKRSARLVLARDGGTTCATCHDFLAGRGGALLRTRADGGKLCLACHDERKELARAPHGRLQGRQGLPCLSCHDIHGGASKDAFLVHAGSASAGDPAGCLGCHGDGRSAQRGRNRPGKEGHPISGGQGDEKLDGCQTCHDPHLAGHAPGPACTDCHSEQAAAQERGGHGSARCPDCHPPHQAPPRGPTPADVNPAAIACLACHAEETPRSRGPKVDTWEHPEPVFLPDGQRWTPLGGLPLFDDEGREVGKGANGDLTCRSCHRVHGPDPDKPGEHLRRPDWKEACSACHGDEALTLYRWFHDAGRRHRDQDGGSP